MPDSKLNSRQQLGDKKMNFISPEASTNSLTLMDYLEISVYSIDLLFGLLYM